MLRIWPAADRLGLGDADELPPHGRRASYGRRAPGAAARVCPGRSSKLKGATRRKRRPTAALDLGASATLSGRGSRGRPVACPHHVRAAAPVTDSAYPPAKAHQSDVKAELTVGSREQASP